MTKKIRDLGRKGTHFEWSDKHEEEFIAVKEHLKETSSIYAYDNKLGMHIFTDAVKHGGLGYVLTQPQEDNKGERIIYCGWTGLADSQRRWPMGELEMGAIVFALTNAKNFTYGAPVIKIFTNHSPLVGLS